MIQGDKVEWNSKINRYCEEYIIEIILGDFLLECLSPDLVETYRMLSADTPPLHFAWYFYRIFARKNWKFASLFGVNMNLMTPKVIRRQRSSSNHSQGPRRGLPRKFRRKLKIYRPPILPLSSWCRLIITPGNILFGTVRKRERQSKRDNFADVSETEKAWRPREVSEVHSSFW